MKLATQAQSLDVWEWRSPWDAPTSLYSVAYGNGQFMAAGEGGIILVSSDGLTWSERLSGLTNEVREGGWSWVVFGNGHFVTMGAFYAHPLQRYSTTATAATDGDGWKSRQIDGWIPIQLLFDGSRFVALMEDNTYSTSRIDTSTDGIDWQTTITVLDESPLNAVAYGNGRFVGIDTSGSFLLSEDGAHWVKQSFGVSNFVRSIAFGNGQFVATSEPTYNTTTEEFDYVFLRSTDGTNWSRSDWASKTDSGSLGYDYVKGQFFLRGQGVLALSADGRAWVEQSTGGEFNALAFGNGRWVGVGYYGVTASSLDGVNWYPRESVTRYDFNDVTFGNHRFVAVGSNGIFTSTNGVNWVQSPSPIPMANSAVAFGNNKFVAAGPGFGNPTAQSIAISNDGINWEGHVAHITPRISNSGQIYSIAFGNGTFVALTGSSEQALINSTDGVNWRLANPVQDNGQAVIMVYDQYVFFGGGLFVTVGLDENYSARILTSSNGVDWRVSWTRESPGFWLLSAAHGNGRFVAVGTYNTSNIDPLGGAEGPTLTFLTSMDGSSWSAYDEFGIGWGMIEEGYVPQAAAFGNGQFVVLERGGWILTSSDGMRWTERHMTTKQGITGAWPHPPLGLAYGDGHFVAVGLLGTILQSGSLSKLDLTPNVSSGTVALALEGPPGLNYTIQSSPDLITWRNLATITNALSGKAVLNDFPTTTGRQFYRAFSQ